jgi:subtilisin family serine protease
VGDVPYRLWSEEAPAPGPPNRTIIAKLKPTTAEGRRATFGARSERERASRRPASDERDSQLARLVQNARVKVIRPVFPDEPIGASSRGVLRRAVRAEAVRAPGIPRARGLVVLEVPRDEDLMQLARHLDGLGAEVEYAYVPRPRRMFAKKTTTKAKRPKQVDPLLSRQWGHVAVRIGAARKLSGFSDATAITVAVADSGVDEEHPDLGSVIAEYKNFLKGEGKRDYEGHGTHVAGIIGAQMNNGVGVAGLCAAKLLALKVLPSRVDWDAAAYYRGLAYCVGRARVLNLSLGAETFDPGERDVIFDLLDAGIVVVAAMGNEFERGNPVEYPAALKGVCAVGATDHADRRGDFSNTGKHVALSAPGVAIVSTTPTYSYAHGKSDYDTWDGTSMATPHVSAAAALVIAQDPELTPAQVIKRLQQTADKVPGMTKRPNTSVGWGRLNIEAALR